MEGSLIDLSKYRMKNAIDDYESAKLLFEQGKYKAAVNRSYYGIFHALRAVTVLDEFDSSISQAKSSSRLLRKIRY